MEKKKLLVTGATGFIGSFIVEEALDRGFEVWAAVRKTSSRKYLQREGINFIELNLDDADILAEQLKDRSFDYVVHSAGLTKSLDKSEFYRVNYGGTKNIVDAIARSGMKLRKFVFISSLSVLGPVREQQPYTEMTDSDTPNANTQYGLSKLAAESCLMERKDLPCIILRPTGVYGPREKDYFMMAQSIRRHVDFAVGYKRQDITFIYVKDLVQAVFLAMETELSHRKYLLSDGNVYQSRTFSDYICDELKVSHVLRITAPLWVLKVVSSVAEALSHLTGRISALNSDKYKIMKQRNWRCDIGPARRELGFKPEYDLKRGVALTMKWYKENGWL